MNEEPVTTETAEDTKPVENLQDAPAATEPAETTPTETAAEKPTVEAKPEENLLDDEPEAKAAETAAPDAPSEEDVRKFTDGIKALDLGDGVRWDDEMLKALTPELMRMSGNDSKKAEGIVKAYAEHQRALVRAATEQKDAFNRSLIDQCKKRFGEDLQKVVAYARAGGREIFGEDIWKEMKKVPSFANNPDIMGKLAEWGRRFATDGGKIAPKGETAPEREGDVLHRMYGNVKV